MAFKDEYENGIYTMIFSGDTSKGEAAWLDAMRSLRDRLAEEKAGYAKLPAKAGFAPAIGIYDRLIACLEEYIAFEPEERKIQEAWNDAPCTSEDCRICEDAATCEDKITE